MNKDLKEIIPGDGLGILKFGMERAEVQRLLGEPDEIDQITEEEMGSNGEAWHYDDMELSLSFDAVENWRLVTFAVSSEFYTIAGHNLIGKKRDQVATVLETLGYGDMIFEETASQNGTESKLLTVGNIEMNFWFENDFLSEIQWGPFFIDDETIDWPE